MTAARQLAIKAEMLADAFRRIGRLDLAGRAGGAVAGRRLPHAGARARAGRPVGLLRRGLAHAVRRDAARGRCRPRARRSIDRLARGARARDQRRRSSAEIEWAETADGARPGGAHHAREGRRQGHGRARRWSTGLDGAELVGDAIARRSTCSWGDVHLVDRIAVGRRRPACRCCITRARSSRATGTCCSRSSTTCSAALAGSRVLDLYAGVGLFSVAAAAAGKTVMAVEGHDTAADDLRRNAAAHPTSLTLPSQRGGGGAGARHGGPLSTR